MYIVLSADLIMDPTAQISIYIVDAARCLNLIVLNVDLGPVVQN